MNREAKPINAGAMADIAFLLLIFFLITTSLNHPKGLHEQLPNKKGEAAPSQPENVLEIMASADGRIMIEGEVIEENEISEWVIQFYKATMPNGENVRLTTTSKRSLHMSIAALEAKIADGDPNTLYQDKRALNALHKKMDAVQLLGDLQIIPDGAMIAIQLDNATSFKVYLNVLDEIMIGLNQMKNELCMEHFGVPLDKLKPSDKYDKEKIEALETAIPKRILKAKARNVGLAHV